MAGAPTAYSVLVEVTSNAVEVGLEQTTAVANWMGLDNVSLKYYGEGAAATAEEIAALTAEIEYAKTLGVDVAKYEALVSAENVNGVVVNIAINEIKVAEYNHVMATYTLDATSKIGDISAWTGTLAPNKGQHWDGTNTTTYYEQNSSGWGAASFDDKASVTVTLSKGKYVLKVAGRAASNEAVQSFIQVGETKVFFTSKGDVGYGIDVNGTANFTSDGTYANDDKGRGFEWRYIAFEVTAEEGEEVTFATGGTASATHMWFSVCNASLLAVHTDALDAEIAKADFAAVIAAAQATVDAKAGVGEGLFLIPAAAFDTYATAVAAAKAIYDNADATLEEVKTAIETLAAATEAYTASQTLPNEKTLYQFKLNVEGDVYMNLSDAGVKIQDTPSAISFVPAEKAGTYYLKSGSYYVGLAGGNAWTMSTSADKKAAWTFTAVGEGLYNINNIVTAGRFVGTNSAEIAAGSSVYADKKTDNGNIKWAISEI